MLQRNITLVFALSFVFSYGTFADEGETPAKANAEESAPAVAAEEPKTSPIEDKAESKEESQCFCLKAGRAILLWLPNRLLDISDIFSLNVGVGSEFAVKTNVTGCFGLGGTFGETYFIEKGFARQYGGGYFSGWEYQNFCWLTEKEYIEDTFGTVKPFVLPPKYFGLPEYDFTYQEDVRDFWAVGAKCGWLAIVDFQIHPVEIFDVVTGIFFIDCLRKDDLQ
jgi:hypothetical protein